MADEGYRRKLTAILHADVEGYSRLMGQDEESTVRTLRINDQWRICLRWSSDDAFDAETVDYHRS